jgi:hypothetical protein
VAGRAAATATAAAPAARCARARVRGCMLLAVWVGCVPADKVTHKRIQNIRTSRSCKLLQLIRRLHPHEHLRPRQPPSAPRQPREQAIYVRSTCLLVTKLLQQLPARRSRGSLS